MRLCRVCLTYDVTNSFEGCFSNNGLIVKIIWNLFEITIVENSDIPAVICRRCEKYVLQAAELKRMCHRADEHFKEGLQRKEYFAWNDNLCELKARLGVKDEKEDVQTSSSSPKTKEGPEKAVPKRSAPPRRMTIATSGAPHESTTSSGHATRSRNSIQPSQLSTSSTASTKPNLAPAPRRSLRQRRLTIAEESATRRSLRSRTVSSTRSSGLIIPKSILKKSPIPAKSKKRLPPRRFTIAAPPNVSSTNALKRDRPEKVSRKINFAKRSTSAKPANAKPSAVPVVSIKPESSPANPIVTLPAPLALPNSTSDHPETPDAIESDNSDCFIDLNELQFDSFIREADDLLVSSLKEIDELGKETQEAVNGEQKSPKIVEDNKSDEGVTLELLAPTDDPDCSFVDRIDITFEEIMEMTEVISSVLPNEEKPRLEKKLENGVKTLGFPEVPRKPIVNILYHQSGSINSSSRTYCDTCSINFSTKHARDVHVIKLHGQTKKNRVMKN